jgi:SAM-dependent methyltransferase
MLNNTKPLSPKSPTDSVLNTANEKDLINSISNVTDIEFVDHHFYDFPRYYDKAFTRDVKSDINFFQKCFQLYSDVKVKRVLEPACGPGMFLEVLPQYGYFALGYDLSPAMVDYSKERLRKHGFTIFQSDALVGNMIDMKFNNKFDASFVCINSLGYLRSDEDILSHFNVMRESLKKGGIYIVEISCKCDDIKNEKKLDDTWYIKEGDLDLELTWAINWYDIENRIRHVDFKMVVEENGQKFIVKEAHDLRLWIYDEFRKFVEDSGFKIVAIYNQKYDLIPPNVSITGELGVLFFVLKNVK